MGSNPTVTAMETPEKSGVFPYPGRGLVHPWCRFPRAQWLVFSVQIVCMAVMIGSYIWVLLKDPEAVARRKRRNEWYVAADWAADYTGWVDYESPPCTCGRCEEQQVSPPPVDTIHES